MLSLVNANRFRKGKGPLGFLNPALYSLAAKHSFTRDITSGNNKCIYTDFCCPEGFKAVDGWDPASGLGSLNFTAFDRVFTALGNTLGRPSPAPSIARKAFAPSAKPTPNPTMPILPTVGKGYATYNTYVGPGCAAKNLAYSESYSLDTCHPLDYVTGIFMGNDVRAKTYQCYKGAHKFIFALCLW